MRNVPRRNVQAKILEGEWMSDEDVERMGEGRLIAILPREFDRWKEEAAA